MKDIPGQIVAIIPARYNSTRFPGKPLKLLLDKPMIQWVYERALEVEQLTQVWVATDDERIARGVRAFGGRVVMTATAHPSGTDRLAEAAQTLGLSPQDLVVNIQGDQAAFPAVLVDQVIEGLLDDPRAAMSTPAHRLADPQTAHNPNLVKVVFDHYHHALYFSRAPIPYWREPDDTPHYYKHIGVYVYRQDFLQRFVKLPPGRWETAEKLEQLRALEHGYNIKIVETDYETAEVDVPEDAVKVEALLRDKL